MTVAVIAAVTVAVIAAVTVAVIAAVTVAVIVAVTVAVIAAAGIATAPRSRPFPNCACVRLCASLSLPPSPPPSPPPSLSHYPPRQVAADNSAIEAALAALDAERGRVQCARRRMVDQVRPNAVK